MITQAQAWLSIGGIVAYVGIAYWQERLRPSAATDVLIDEAGLVKPAFPRLVSEVLTTAIGLGAILAGAWLFIQGADNLVELFGVSGTFVGLFMVAVGTSLPELTISVVASVKKKPDVVLGNIIGSNLFNTLAIPGLIAAYMPFEIPAELQSVDLAVMVAATLLLVIFAATKMRISRLDGALFVVGYFAYLVGRATLA